MPQEMRRETRENCWWLLEIRVFSVIGREDGFEESIPGANRRNSSDRHFKERKLIQSSHASTFSEKSVTRFLIYSLLIASAASAGQFSTSLGDQYPYTVSAITTDALGNTMPSEAANSVFPQ
jgi:hypothetical protein